MIIIWLNRGISDCPSVCQYSPDNHFNLGGCVAEEVQFLLMSSCQENRRPSIDFARFKLSTAQSLMCTSFIGTALVFVNLTKLPQRNGNKTWDDSLRQPNQILFAREMFLLALPESLYPGRESPTTPHTI